MFKLSQVVYLNFYLMNGNIIVPLAFYYASEKNDYCVTKLLPFEKKG